MQRSRLCTTGTRVAVNTQPTGSMSVVHLHYCSPGSLLKSEEIHLYSLRVHCSELFLMVSIYILSSGELIKGKRCKTRFVSLLSLIEEG